MKRIALAAFLALSPLPAPAQPAGDGGRPLAGANERAANWAVHIYRAEVCGWRTAEWARRTLENAALMLGNIDMEDRRPGTDGVITDRVLRQRQIERLVHYARIAPSMGAGCNSGHSMQMVSLIDRTLNAEFVAVLGRLEARWWTGQAAPAARGG